MTLIFGGGSGFLTCLSKVLIKTGGGIENKEPGATIVKGSKERSSKTLKWELKLQRYLECKERTRRFILH